jgi:two-component system sensor histidine kinase VicK
LVVGLAGVIILVLLGIVYAFNQQHFVLYALIGLIVGCSASAAIFWMTQLERQAKRADELDHLKSEFVSRVSHELRTPLTTIKTLTRLLLRGDVSKEKQEEFLTTIAVECDQQIDLVLNLLDLSRIEAGVFRLAMERVELPDVIRTCVTAELTAAERRKHQLRAEGSADVPPVYADPRTLRRVVTNLIENSIKYTPNGGLITLSTDFESDFVALHVSDNGCGIPKEDLPILFDKFYRGNSVQQAAIKTEEVLEDVDVSGLGLGLYLARDIMERMGGRITVKTTLGIGSTFTLHLPVWKPEYIGNGAQHAETYTGCRR